MFSVKGHRAIVTKRDAPDAGELLKWFLASGVLELGDTLGPLLWQLLPNRRYDRDQTAAFLDLLPEDVIDPLARTRGNRI